jgi:hypothetical protein
MTAAGRCAGVAVLLLCAVPGCLGGPGLEPPGQGRASSLPPSSANDGTASGDAGVAEQTPGVPTQGHDVADDAGADDAGR